MKRSIKYIVLLLLAGSAGMGTAWGQHHFGVRAGYGGGTVRFEPRREMAYLFGSPTVGISWKYYSPERVTGGIEVDLQRVTKGYKKWDAVGSDTYETRTLEAIELPFMWQPHFYVFNRRGRIFVNLGVYISYIYASEREWVSVTNGVLLSEKYEFMSVRDNQFEYGLCGGVGFSVLLNRFELFAEGRYSFGFSDMLKAYAKYPGNPYQRSPMDMINISAGVFYRIGKGGILARPSEKNRMKMGNWDEVSGPSVSTPPDREARP